MHVLILRKKQVCENVSNECASSQLSALRHVATGRVTMFQSVCVCVLFKKGFLFITKVKVGVGFKCRCSVNYLYKSLC